MGKKKKNKKLKKQKAIAMGIKNSGGNYLDITEYYKSEFDKLLEENAKLRQGIGVNKSELEVENLRLKEENEKLKISAEEHQALLQLNVDFKEHIIQLRNKINELRTELNEQKNTVSD